MCNECVGVRCNEGPFERHDICLVLKLYREFVVLTGIPNNAEVTVLLIVTSTYITGYGVKAPVCCAELLCFCVLLTV
jgi:hypothetical protein